MLTVRLVNRSSALTLIRSAGLLIAVALACRSAGGQTVMGMYVRQQLGDGSSEHALLTDIRGLTTDRAGRVLVADYTENVVRVFEPTGRYLFSFGRPGRGPGDFAGPCCIAVDASDRLWVREAVNRRYSIFELSRTNARFLWSIPIRGNPDGGMFRIPFIGASGVLDVTNAIIDGPPGVVEVRAILDSSGRASAVDTVAPTPVDSQTTIVAVRATARGTSRTTYAQPYGARHLRAYGPRGERAEAVSSSYLVRIVRGAGQRTQTLRREVGGVRLSPAEVDTATRMIAAISAQVQGTAIRFTVPKSKGPLRSLGFDLDGRLWVERAAPDADGTVFDVFTPTGEFLWKIQVPDRVSIQLFALRGRSGFGVQRDDDGVPRVVRLEIMP